MVSKERTPSCRTAFWMQTEKERIYVCYIQGNLKHREDNNMFTQRNLKTSRRDVAQMVQVEPYVILAGGSTMVWNLGKRLDITPRIL